MIKLRTAIAGIFVACALTVSLPASAQCTVPNVLTNGQVADASEVMGNFEAVAACADDLAEATVTHTGTPAAGEIAVFSGDKSLTGGDLTGDVTTSGGTVTTLATSGVTAGTYSNPMISVDAKGRITAAASGSGGGGSGGAGTVFPPSPPTGERFFRTDRGIEYYWNGTRWLSTQVFMLQAPTNRLDYPVSSNSVPGSFQNPWHGLYDIYAEAWIGAGDMNGTSNWTVRMNSPLGAFNANLSATGSASDVELVAINGIFPSTVVGWYWELIRTSGSGGIYATGQLRYRLVG